MNNQERLEELIEELYCFLRDEGFNEESKGLKQALFHLKNGNLPLAEEEIRSASISGGAGSVFDIGFREKAKREYKDQLLDEIYNILGIKAYKKIPRWRIW